MHSYSMLTEDRDMRWCVVFDNRDSSPFYCKFTNKDCLRSVRRLYTIYFVALSAVPAAVDRDYFSLSKGQNEVQNAASFT